MHHSNETIVAALTNGTERERREAFAFILNQSGWSRMSIGYVMKRGGTYEDAEEVLSDALYFFDRNLREGHYRGDGNPEAYFMNIVARQWLKRLEKIRRRKRLFDLFGWKQQTEALNREEMEWYERKEAVELLNELIASKGKHCRELLRLYQLDYSLEETARMMGWQSADQVKTEKNRCIQRTREHLKRHPEWKFLFKN